MFLSYFTLFVALSLSAVAAWYSILGLTAIFASAVVPIIIMGTMLEVAKVTVTVWLHEHWRRCQWLMKVYLVPAVAMLMVITSLGVFGFLSKAHSDQSLVSGDVQSRIAVYDEKIKTAKENIEADRRQLKQMDEAVDQTMARSTSETGAASANNIRKNQQRDRSAIARNIEANQKSISRLNDEAAPIRAEIRKVEAEVGPIKYIAAAIYGDNPDANLLERSVRWVIMLLVIVFDPLAIMMVLAATKSIKWTKDDRTAQYLPDDDALSKEQVEQIQQSAPESVMHNDPDLGNCYKCDVPLIHAAGIGSFCPNKDCDVLDDINDSDPQSFDFDKHAYLKQPFVHFVNLTPMVAPTPATVEIDQDHDDIDQDHEEMAQDEEGLRLAKTRWKELNPGQTLKSQRAKLTRGEIAELPWLALIRETSQSFGDNFPTDPVRGDTFVYTHVFPNELYKFNGDEWILLDKLNTDNYTYDTAYVDYLIAMIASGEYDPDLLSAGESEQVAERLKNITNT